MQAGSNGEKSAHFFSDNDVPQGCDSFIDNVDLGLLDAPYESIARNRQRLFVDQRRQRDAREHSCLEGMFLAVQKNYLNRIRMSFIAFRTDRFNGSFQ